MTCATGPVQEIQQNRKTDSGRVGSEKTKAANAPTVIPTSLQKGKSQCSHTHSHTHIHVNTTHTTDSKVGASLTTS